VRICNSPGGGSPDADCAQGFQPFAQSVPWTLAPGGDGPRHVLVWVQDAAGGVQAAPAAASVALDTAPPSGAVEINGGAAATGSLQARVGWGAAWGQRGQRVARDCLCARACMQWQNAARTSVFAPTRLAPARPGPRR
jgi:hypothetical protein